VHPERIVSKRPALLEPSDSQMQAVSVRKCRSLAFDEHPRQKAVATLLVDKHVDMRRYAGSENNHAIAKTNRDSHCMTHKPGLHQRMFADSGANADGYPRSSPCIQFIHRTRLSHCCRGLRCQVSVTGRKSRGCAPLHSCCRSNRLLRSL
jgi:hypothetical protein